MNETIFNLSLLKFSEFTTKDNQKLYGNDRGGECILRAWILFGADRVFMQGELFNLLTLT